jgi:hypothetical protein
MSRVGSPVPPLRSLAVRAARATTSMPLLTELSASSQRPRHSVGDACKVQAHGDPLTAGPAPTQAPSGSASAGRQGH